MLEWMHDNQINSQFVTPFSIYTEEQVHRFIHQAQIDCQTNLHLACVDSRDQYLGTVSLKNISQENRNAEYAICFRTSAHGTGAACYATSSILRIAFEELNLERVYLYLLAENTRADRFYQKSGFIYEGTAVRSMLHHDKLCDVKWYRMLKAEWLRRTEVE